MHVAVNALLALEALYIILLTLFHDLQIVTLYEVRGLRRCFEPSDGSAKYENHGLRRRLVMAYPESGSS